MLYIWLHHSPPPLHAITTTHYITTLGNCSKPQTHRNNHLQSGSLHVHHKVLFATGLHITFGFSHFMQPFIQLLIELFSVVDCVWNVMAHAQKPDFVFRRNGRVHLNRQWHQFSRLLAAEVCASAVVMLDTPRSEVVWRVLATHSTRQFPLHFPSRASPCAITFQLESTTVWPASE
jgi:hypothetical protein